MVTFSQYHLSISFGPEGLTIFVIFLDMRSKNYIVWVTNAFPLPQGAFLEIRLPLSLLSGVLRIYWPQQNSSGGEGSKEGSARRGSSGRGQALIATSWFRSARSRASCSCGRRPDQPLSTNFLFVATVCQNRKKWSTNFNDHYVVASFLRGQVLAIRAKPNRSSELSEKLCARTRAHQQRTHVCRFVWNFTKRGPRIAEINRICWNSADI